MKKLLPVALIAIIILIAGGVLILNSRNQKTASQDSTFQSPSTDSSPVLEIFAGSVEVNSSIAQNGQKINTGDIITTSPDGRAQILYPNHSVTRIDFKSQATVKEFQNNPKITKVKVDKGRIWSRVAKLFGKDDSSETETDTLVASVRGTSYGHGILSDGSNKISVSKSQVQVDCSIGTKANLLVAVNKKVTTKCAGQLSTVNWDSTDINDEWFIFNKSEDDKLDQRFGKDAYGDEATPTPSANPAVKGAATTAPTSTPKPTQTSNPTSTPTPTPTEYIKPTPKPTITPTPTPTPTYFIYTPPTKIILPTPTPVQLR